jgi:hypothetical protein
LGETVTERVDQRLISISGRFYRRLEELSLRHDRTVDDLLEHAIELHFGDDATQARLRLMDRLARLEARLGDSDALLEEIAEATRALRSRPSHQAQRA